MLESLDDDFRVADLAEKFAVSENTIYNWRSSYYKEQGIQPEGQGVEIFTPEQRPIKQLKK